MKKTWIIIAASLILAGSLIFVGVMTMLKWDFTKLSTVSYETNDYEITEEFTNISVDTDTARITFVPTDGASRVECVEQEYAKHTVCVKNGILEIKLQNNKKWYHHIGISFGSPKLTVYLPRGEYGALSIDTSTGDIKLPEDFAFAGMDITASTGNVESGADVSGVVNIKTSTGNISVQNTTAESLSLSVSTGQVTATDVTCTGEMKVKVSTGKSKLTNIRCGSLWSTGSTGGMTLQNVIADGSFSIRRSTGGVKLEGCDAAEINITTDTGNVTGSLLSEKVFITETDTGTIKVPESTTGGKCKITTSTGNIKINID